MAPAAGNEADRYRVAEEKLQALSVDAITAVRTCGGAGAVPPEFETVFACWCVVLGEEPHTIERCAELAADPSEFKLVGASSFSSLSPEELGTLTSKVATIDAAEVRRRPAPSAEAAASLLEFMQAGIDLNSWAEK